jgi:hypothetical protein
MRRATQPNSDGPGDPSGQHSITRSSKTSPERLPGFRFDKLGHVAADAWIALPPTLKLSDVKIAEFSGPTVMYPERRKLGRTVVRQRAKLLLPNFDGPQDCVVRNLSTIGACIEFDANRIGRIHKKFELSFDNFVTGWSCHVIWQFRGLVGVSWTCAFLEEKRLTG